MDEQGGGWSSWCKPEWQVIRAAPRAFVSSVLALSILIAIGLYWLFHENLQMKTDLIGSLKEKEEQLKKEMGALKEKLGAGEYDPKAQTTIPSTVNLATFVNVIALLPLRKPVIFQAGQTADINVFMGNAGPHLAQDAKWDAAVILAREPFGQSMLDSLYVDFKSTKRSGLGSDINPGMFGWRTFSSRKLTEQDIKDLKEDRMRLFVVGYIDYRDIRGPHETEFCYLLMPLRNDHPIWGTCLTHNRFIK